MDARMKPGRWRLPKWLARFISYGTEGLRGPDLRQRRTLNVISALIPMSGLGDDFTFEKREEIEVKGIGIVETWWLTGRI